MANIAIFYDISNGPASKIVIILPIEELKAIELFKKEKQIKKILAKLWGFSAF